MPQHRGIDEGKKSCSLNTHREIMKRSNSEKVELWKVELWKTKLRKCQAMKRSNLKGWTLKGWTLKRSDWTKKDNKKLYFSLFHNIVTFPPTLTISFSAFTFIGRLYHFWTNFFLYHFVFDLNTFSFSIILNFCRSSLKCHPESAFFLTFFSTFAISTVS